MATSWGMATFHPTLPRGTRIKTETVGTLEEILVGPARENDGTLNLMGALRMSMATTGYQNIKEFQKGRGHVRAVARHRGEGRAALPGRRDGTVNELLILVLDFGGQYAQLIARQGARVPGLLGAHPLRYSRSRR